MDDSEARAARSPRPPGSARPTRGGLERRTVVKGAAWGLPVIATAIAVPAHAASVLCPPAVTLTATAANVTGGPTATLLVPIASNVTQIDYVVTGGSGGGWTFIAGGFGATITGSIPVASLGGATNLLLTAGGPGQGRGGFNNPGRLGNGGTGYGNGGRGLGSVGSGGGGSAITFPDGTPLVVAGGGGGGANAVNVNGSNHTGIAFFNTPPDGGLGRGGLPGQAAERSLAWNITDNTIATSIVATGIGAGGGTGSAPGQPGTTTPAQPGTTTAAGSPGTAPTTSGGNGGDGATLALIPMPGNWVSGGGGGGGGYAGGAGGNSIAYDNPNNNMWANVSASGAGGSSYVAPGIAYTASYSGSGPGSVTLTFIC